MDSLDNILYARLSSDIYCLVHNKIVELQRENKKLEEKLYDEVDISTSRLKENIELKKQNEFLMQRDNKCQILEQVINRINDYIRECCNMDSKTVNLHYEYAQNGMSEDQVDELLDILKEVE